MEAGREKVRPERSRGLNRACGRSLTHARPGWVGAASEGTGNEKKRDAALKGRCYSQGKAKTQTECRSYRLFTFCVHFCKVLQHPAPENGILMSAYHVLHTGHSRIQQSRSPESTWN